MPQETTAPTELTATTAGLTILRAAFPPEQIQHLPKIWCSNCSNSRTKVCENHRKGKCNSCGNMITSAHLDLDYVGHAELTNRLLDADLTWDWEPVAWTERGLPAMDECGGLWIRLTVCGVTRLGYGDAAGKKGPNAVKEAIGDALRNAAMRFGAALDLWAKSDLSSAQADITPPDEDGETEPAATPPAPAPQRQPLSRGRRDYLGEARAATTFDQVRGIYNAAAAASSSTELLDLIRGIGDQLAAGEQTEPAPGRGAPSPSLEDTKRDFADYRAAWFEAERALRQAADHVGMTDVPAQFQRSYGCPIAEASPEQLRNMTDVLLGNVA